MKTTGIIGFGSFGQFLAEKLAPHTKVQIYSNSGKSNPWKATLAEVAACDYVLPAVPLNAYEKTFSDLKGKLGRQTVIVDVCSVKEQPIKLIQKILPEQPLVATHPLFGPESAKDSLAGHTLVLCPEDSDPVALAAVERFAQEMQLTIVKMSAAEHDREMALVHGLTFFIAHALKDLKLQDQKLTTPSFQKLLALAKLEQHHSDDLFHTIQAGNDQTRAVRKRFIELCQKLDTYITS